LWVVRQFVASWGGTIRVDSRAGGQDHGTTFALFLPLVSVPERQGAG